MKPILELRDVSKLFGAQRAVDGITLQVQAGEFYSLLGPSGCGKTTTLRIIAGFEEPTSGDVLLQGNRINHLRPYQRNVSTVFQSYALFPHLSAARNVEFGLRRKRLPEAEIRRKVAAAFELVQLSGKEDRMPAQLSGGERQRVALARSLVLEPAILLLDEPLSALDPNLRKQVRAELKSLQRRTGVTFIFVTHDQEEALSLSDRIALLNQGKVEQIGSPRDLYLQPATRFVASFLGTVNWIGTVGVRPEALRVVRQSPDSSATSVPAVVEGVTFLGSAVHLQARLHTGETITSEVSRLDDVYQPGDQVHVWWRGADELRPPS